MNKCRNKYKKDQNMPEENKQKLGGYMQEYRKNQSNNFLKEIKENFELKSVEVNMITNFIQNKV